MGVFNGLFPLLPGKEAAARAWLAAVAGPRREGFAALQRRAELTRETLTLQRTPAGAVLLVWFEGNVAKAFEVIATGEDAFTVWHRTQLQDVTGIDLRQPAAGPLPEVLLDWRA
jgi:hypothetical protein